MANKDSAKINLAALQVLKTLLVLWEKELTMSELVDKLNKNEKTHIYNSSVLSKYINTCRYAGFDIPKISNKYFVTSIPFKIDFDNKELDLISRMQIAAERFLTNKNYAIFEKFLEKLSRFTNNKVVKVDKKLTYIAYEKFEDAIESMHKVILITKINEEIECIPLAIVENGEKVFFKIYHEAREKLILVDRVNGIKITDTKFLKPNLSNVVFKIRGDLAKRYTLHEDEEIIEYGSGEITVSCKPEGKDILLSRLLRYDNCCEIIFPKDYREDMKNIIKTSLENYGVYK